MFLETPENPQENTCAESLFIKKETPAQVVSCEFCEISKNIFFTEHLRATASFFHVSNGSKKHLEFKIMTLVNFFFMVIVLM